MKLAELIPGTRLEVTWTAVNGDRSPVYISQLLESPRERQLLIAIPISGFRLVAWPPDRPIQITFVQKDQGIWTFTASLVCPLELDRIAAWRIQANDDLTRRQRRAWYRLPCTLDLTYRLTGQASGEPAARPAITRDVSGGGLSLVTDQPIQANTKIEITLHLDNQQTITAHGQILRISEPEDLNSDHASPRRLISLQFNAIEPHEREALIRFVLRRQMQQLRNRGDKQLKHE